jgi:hypothetical protein
VVEKYNGNLGQGYDGTIDEFAGEENLTVSQRLYCLFNSLLASSAYLEEGF